ncbi:MAG: HAD-IA family hydrolase [Bacteroidales bacterium]|jgi:3-deoxy-D-manno-octulosonate 8-phosphate phosphatase (KDO 8-P phosphatase)|nr:HAD-IA family hydrolase [Bacteroidales bacterium]
MNYRERLHKVNTFIFDFDGVLSDGKIYVLPDGDQIRATDTKDGYAIHYALKLGYKVCIISGGYSDTMRLRFTNFPQMDIFLKVSDKMKTFEEYRKNNQLEYENIMYVGDDIPDIPVLKLAGIACCPEDASEEVKTVAHYISHKKGGSGCIRDVIEQTLKAQQKWMGADAHIW